MDMSNNSNKKRPPPKTSSRRSSTKKQASLKTGFASVFTQQQDKWYNQALSEQYKGKRVLLSSDFVYGRRPIPDSEDDLLFVYNVESVDESNDAFRRYLHELNPNHRPPYRLERVCMLEVIMDMAANEFVRILEEQRAKLVHSFLSGDSR